MSKIKIAGYISKEHECNAYYETNGIIPTLRGNSGGQTKGRAIIQRERERVTSVGLRRLSARDYRVFPITGHREFQKQIDINV